MIIHTRRNSLYQVILAAGVLLAALLAVSRPVRADHEPTFIEFSTDGEVFAFNFTHNAELTFTIYDAGGGIVAVEPVTADGSGFAELRHDAWHGGPGPAVNPGFSAEVTDGVYTRTVTLVDVLIDTYRIDHNSLAGRAPAGELVTIYISEGGPDIVVADTPVDAAGRWTFSVNPLDADLSDPGIVVSAAVFDSDGDSSFDVYQLPPSTCANVNIHVTYFGANIDPVGYGFEVFLHSSIDPAGLEAVLFAGGMELEYEGAFLEGFDPGPGVYNMFIFGSFEGEPPLGAYEIILRAEDGTLRAPCVPEVYGDYRAHIVDLEDIPTGAPEIVSPPHLAPVSVHGLAAVEWLPFSGSYNGTAPIDPEGHFAAVDLFGQFFAVGLDGVATSAGIADMVDEETGESLPVPLPPGIHTFVVAAGYSPKPDLTFEHHRIHLGILFDPDSGFVTGGGHFDAAVGAAAGSANIGFVAKYKKDSSYPEGEVEFVFQEAGINFHSEQLYVLAINGDTALIAGSGRLNGEPGWEFELVIVDGKLTPDGEDLVRIVIFGPGGPVYPDEPPGALVPIQGSVVIHTK